MVDKIGIEVFLLKRKIVFVRLCAWLVGSLAKCVNRNNLGRVVLDRKWLDRL